MFLRPEVVRVSLWAVLGVWLVRRLARLVPLLVRSPAAVAGLVLVAAFVTGWQMVHPALPVGLLGGLAVGLVVWRVRWPASFTLHVGGQTRSWWRGAWVYRRRWAVAMDTVGLDKHRHGTDYLPVLLRVRSSRWMDKVTVRMLPGQRVQDFVDVADRLRHTFGVHDCRVRSTRSAHQVQLWLLVRDPLDALVAPFPPAASLAAGLPVAMTEDGTPWLLKLLDNHLLISGATGAGKSGVLWCIIAALAGFIRAGVVKIWAVDPKGGMELAFGRPLFDRFAYGNPNSPGGYEASLAQLLEDAVAEMGLSACLCMCLTGVHGLRSGPVGRGTSHRIG